MITTMISSAVKVARGKQVATEFANFKLYITA